jgi:hypothetical protein
MYSEQSGQDFGGGRSDCIYNSTAAFGAWREDREAGALSQRDYKSTNHILIGNGGGAARVCCVPQVEESKDCE